VSPVTPSRFLRVESFSHLKREGSSLLFTSVIHGDPDSCFWSEKTSSSFFFLGDFFFLFSQNSLFPQLVRKRPFTSLYGQGHLYPPLFPGKEGTRFWLGEKFFPRGQRDPLSKMCFSRANTRNFRSPLPPFKKEGSPLFHFVSWQDVLGCPPPFLFL